MATSARERSTCAAGALSERLRRVSSWRSSAVSGRRGSCWWRDMGHLGARGSPHHHTRSHGKRPIRWARRLLSDGMLWQPRADHEQKHELGDVTITQGLDATRPITEVLQLHPYCRYGPLLGESGRGGASMSVAVWSGSLVAWERELVALKERIGPVFGRAETRATAGAFLDGLLSGVARKTGWLLAEQAGLERPYRMQSLLGRSHWDADALRDCVRADVIEVLGDRDGVLVVDETGFLKKGEHSVGVARQYSGTAGRIENCQIGVFLAYASRYGQALIDRRLYLPDAWAQDESKRAKAGVPEEITFATKPEIACTLIAAALDAGVPCAWVLADALYGSDSRLRRMLESRMLETRGQPYGLAVRSNHCLRVWTEEG